MEEKVIRIKKRKHCAFCSMEAETVCDHGWPGEPCNVPMCDKHTTSVDQGNGTEMDFCPNHKNAVAMHA